MAQDAINTTKSEGNECVIEFTCNRYLSPEVSRLASKLEDSLLEFIDNSRGGN